MRQTYHWKVHWIIIFQFYSSQFFCQLFCLFWQKPTNLMLHFSVWHAECNTPIYKNVCIVPRCQCWAKIFSLKNVVSEACKICFYLFEWIQNWNASQKKIIFSCCLLFVYGNVINNLSNEKKAENINNGNGNEEIPYLPKLRLVFFYSNQFVVLNNECLFKIRRIHCVNRHSLLSFQMEKCEWVIFLFSLNIL